MSQYLILKYQIQKQGKRDSNPRERFWRPRYCRCMIPLYLYNIPRNNYYTWNTMFLSIFFCTFKNPYSLQPSIFFLPVFLKVKPSTD